MKLIPHYRVCYNGVFHEAGEAFQIKEMDAAVMTEHGSVLDEPTPPISAHRKPGRPRRSENGQSGKTEAPNE